MAVNSFVEDVHPERRIFDPLGQIIHYSIDRYPFEAIIRTALQVPNLSMLHELAAYGLFRRETDQKTLWHERYYCAFDSEIGAVYRAFIEDVIRPLFDEPIAAQRVPTFRVHLANNVGVGEFHRDRDYQHPSGEVNFLLPLTRAWDTNSIWIESSEGAEDYRSIELQYGQVFCFDGLRLKHGNKINSTGFTRVSFDFRTIPTRLCAHASGRSVNTGSPFHLGGYYYQVDRSKWGSAWSATARSL